MSSPTPEQITVWLRPCPTCGAHPAEKCRKDGGGWHDRYTHTARSEETKAEKQHRYTEGYQARKRTADNARRADQEARARKRPQP